MCRPAVVPCTIFAVLISGSRVPFSAQDAGCVCLLLWCGVLADACHLHYLLLLLLFTSRYLHRMLAAWPCVFARGSAWISAISLGL